MKATHSLLLYSLVIVLLLQGCKSYAPVLYYGENASRARIYYLIEIGKHYKIRLKSGEELVVDVTRKDSITVYGTVKVPSVYEKVEHSSNYGTHAIPFKNIKGIDEWKINKRRSWLLTSIIVSVLLAYTEHKIDN